MRALLAQMRVELLLTLRRGESLLVAIGIPVGILVFFSLVDVLPHGTDEPVDFLVAGVLALSVIASAMTSLGIATGFERQAGVLRLLGTTPLGRGGLLGAKLASLVAVVALQTLAVVAVGWGLGWRAAGGVGVAALMLALGVACFAGLGFLLAGRLRAETNLALANGLFLVLLLLGGVVVPVEALPEALAGLSRLLPAEPLSTGLRDALAGHAVPFRVWGTLGTWTAGATLLAVRGFRWDTSH